MFKKQAKVFRAGTVVVERRVDGEHPDEKDK